ncbi:hypothetical protein [Thermoanaerobacterium thermosaccharolyticum]|uniref:hypothetical protein n=1 Tax=Thermoanaerobacterium thermosaccharolyticum TaxID=1517 RepID=UPI0012DF3F69|nr:hypothetical protein [Thermoanaerobacterium thermosaccharolyticum]
MYSEILLSNRRCISTGLKHSINYPLYKGKRVRIFNVSRSLLRHIKLSVERIANLVELEPVFVPMSEFEKSGACLSCLVMHLNWR